MSPSRHLAGRRRRRRSSRGGGGGGACLVSLEMFTKMIATHESLATARTRESLFTRVRLEVTLQLVGTRERFAAEQPRAGERAFTGVPAQVRLEM